MSIGDKDMQCVWQFVSIFMKRVRGKTSLEVFVSQEKI